MARIRTIKPEFWTSAQVMECSPNARLLFIGLWNFADDAGRMALSPKRIKAQIYPSDDFTAADVRRMIDELAANDLVSVYVVDDEEFLAITGWHHQKIDRPQDPRTPEPPDGHSPNGRRTFGVGREGKGEDRKGKDLKAAANGAHPPREGRTLNAVAPPVPGPQPADARRQPPAEPDHGHAAPPPASRPATPTRECDTAAGFDRIAGRCREVLPETWGLRVEADARPVVQLVREGLDLESEIVPALREVACRRTPIRTWPLLANAVAERVMAQRSARTAQGLSPKPPAPPRPEEMIDLGSPYGAYGEAVLRVFVEKFRADPTAWIEHLVGPAPGRPGCRIPARLLLTEAA
ncbi:hypothetical protein M446_4096 [Methylobacterium sp. 4-46]|uniref:hypothetical protein n=1 Tax=unclassified Methylobacterium TaxID=2615210 RepID=UPI000152DDB6|nr:MULTISPECIES: hypothetical protein [Methylobacterium]ACA18454.1 hypothetical protein M446_4096 [Methylobacterium sp. 4-46]WFT77745.1 hypothetical protein QA634_20815 [Methylobacterium nodulans]